MKSPSLANTQSIIEELSAITRMERGKLTSEYRTRLDSDGNGEIVKGPYWKLQARENGKNNSRRISLKEVPILQSDLESHKKFKSLISTLEEEIISNTRSLRADEVELLSSDHSKKNSTSKRNLKNTRKQKPSSPKSGNA
jgi:hypothetical protein